MGERQRPANAWINWKRIRADWDEGFTPSVCAAKENCRLILAGEHRRVTPDHVSHYAYLNDWPKPYRKGA